MDWQDVSPQTATDAEIDEALALAQGWIVVESLGEKWTYRVNGRGKQIEPSRHVGTFDSPSLTATWNPTGNHEQAWGVVEPFRAANVVLLDVFPDSVTAQIRSDNTWSVETPTVPDALSRLALALYQWQAKAVSA